MDTVQDFEDILDLFDQHAVRYLIIGGLAFTYHAKPRYTKDIDLWVDSDQKNVQRVNRALTEFGSPFLRDPGGVEFEQAWPRKVEARYGNAKANWIDIDSLIAIKSRIDHPRHQNDAEVLRRVRERGGAQG